MVAASKISVPPARAEIKRWLPVRFVHREQAFCFASVARSQRSLLSGFVFPASNIFRYASGRGGIFGARFSPWWGERTRRILIVRE
jgi:hypothetical protein